MPVTSSQLPLQLSMKLMLFVGSNSKIEMADSVSSISSCAGDKNK
ncbi:hypothetical protein W04_1504 [Pseudoalteromonas sp. SW0106-04]|nr:hypothetical protein W04_1504 [Pseudoalteromonas sp. SW0106-04]